MEKQKAAKNIKVSPGEMVKTLRELKELSQLELAELCDISQTNISAIENQRVEVGKQRAIALARAFHVHPASIMFSDWDESGVA